MANNSFQAESLNNTSITLDSISIPKGQRITVHMCHINHLDLMWHWNFTDSIEMCLDTIRWHIELIKSHPEARYSHSQIYILRLIEELDKDLFKEFSDLVKKGVIEIDSGQLFETDHNLPAGESFIRNFLYGQSYIKEKFGKQSKVLINSDSFGHFSNLPQIMKGFGIKLFIFKRPRQKFVNLPETLFWWKGIDGSQILSLRFLNKSSGMPHLSQYYDLNKIEEIQKKIDLNLEVGVTNLLGTHCESDTGGAAPYFAPCAGENWQLKYSTPTDFCESISEQTEKIPTYENKLNFVYPACYTTHIEEKEDLRKAEKLLFQCELLASLASVMGQEYPFEKIEDCWWTCLFGQFHDTICGTGSKDMHLESRSFYHQSFVELSKIIRKSQLYIEKRLQSCKPLKTIIHFNTAPTRIREHLEVDLNTQLDIYDNFNYSQLAESGFIKDENDKLIKYQIIEKRNYQRYQHSKIIFVPDSSNCVGLSTYELLQCEQDKKSSPCTYNLSCLQNDYYTIGFDSKGNINSIKNKADGFEYLKDGPINYEFWPETDYEGDYGSEMKAWFLGSTDKYENPTLVDRPKILENGPVRTRVLVKHKWHKSTIETYISLYNETDYIDIDILVDWHEKEVLLKFSLPVMDSNNSKAIYGLPFGFEKYSDKDTEIPAYGWADISNKDYGIALLNIDRPGYDLRDGCIRLSVVRCSTGDYDKCSDEGKISCKLRIIPHNKDFIDANIPLRAKTFMNHSLAWQVTSFRFKPAQDEMNKFKGLWRSNNILLSCVKRSQDGEGLVLRFYESLGIQSDLEISLPSEFRSLHRLRLDEKALEELQPTTNNIYLIKFFPFEIKTFKLL